MQQQRPWRRRLIFALAAILAYVTGFAAVWAIGPRFGLPTHPLPDVTVPTPAPSKPIKPRPRYVLLLGVDERMDDVGRSDTMILARIEGGNVRLLAIPRDTMVRIPGRGTDKANAAYAYGGADLAKQTVTALTGLPVDYYVKLNLKGFRHLVDLMGGVEYTVEKRMYYVDPYDDLVINLQPGPQVLDGEKAEQYVRFRYDPDGDVSRVRRQQTFIKAVFQQALSARNLTRLPNMAYTALQYVETDVPLAEQARLVGGFATATDRQFNQEVIPGVGDYVGEISYFLPNWEEFRTLLEGWS